MKKDISTGEMAQCLEAISQTSKGAAEIRLPPAEVYSYASPAGRDVYINFVNPAGLPIGAIYRTWIVRFTAGKPELVTYFRSRRGESGDETLPPDDVYE
jgi:hypothetical protein